MAKGYIDTRELAEYKCPRDVYEYSLLHLCSAPLTDAVKEIPPTIKSIMMHLEGTTVTTNSIELKFILDEDTIRKALNSDKDLAARVKDIGYKASIVAAIFDHNPFMVDWFNDKNMLTISYQQFKPTLMSMIAIYQTAKKKGLLTNV